MADAQSLDTARIQTNGWRQGAVCQKSTLTADDTSAYPVISSFGGDSALAILISHDCDIVHPGINEPVVEWLVATPIAKKDRDHLCLHGRNPRRLHFEHHDTVYEVLAQNRVTTSRAVLERVSAEANLSLTAHLTTLVTHWISKRYIRPAFPDAFNTRLQTAQRDIRRALENGHQLFRYLLIHVEPMSELAADETYYLSILGIMVKEDYENAERREQCQRVINQLEGDVEACANVSVKDCELQSADSTPISVLDYYRPWDFDYLSVRDSE
jgi:hypothetical protein